MIKPLALGLLGLLLISATATADSADDRQYVMWPNGNGKVHLKAKVDASASVDKDSKVGPYVAVEKGAQLVHSIVMGESETKPAKVGAGARLENSTLQGAFVIGDKARVKGTILQGPITVKSGLAITTCTLSAMPGQPATIDKDLTGEMLMLPRTR
jgi:NDP-sugar pyrophosphorylase family protein